MALPSELDILYTQQLAYVTVKMNSLSLAPSPCHLLELPGELRNKIYDHVLGTHDLPALILLSKARPPEKALSLTCQQIHNEFHQSYLEGYRKYWRSVTFKISLEAEKDDWVRGIPHSMHKPRDADLDQIQSFSLLGRHLSIDLHKCIKHKDIWSIRLTYAGVRSLYFGPWCEKAAPIPVFAILFIFMESHQVPGTS